MNPRLGAQKKMRKQSPATLRAVLRYEPETGRLFWLERPIDMFATVLEANSWNARCAGKEAFTSTNGAGYRVGDVLGVRYLAHRVGWTIKTGSWPKAEIDHINGVTSDNRFANLREVTHAENMKNKRRNANNASGVTGVHWERASGKWVAKIEISGVQRHLGRFSDLAAASAARAAAEAEHKFHMNHGRATCPGHSSHPHRPVVGIQKEQAVKKSDLIEAIQAHKPRLTKSEIQTVIDGLTAAAKATIARGDDFAIPGIVRLSVANRAARMGRNPGTGAPIEIEARKAIVAKVSGELKTALASAE